MKQESEIREKFYDILNKEFKKRLHLYLSRKYINCKYNVRFDVKDHGKVGFCRNQKVLDQSIRNTFVCSDEYSCDNCVYYECKHTEESIKSDFECIIKDPAVCGREYPKLAVLIWLFSDDQKVSKYDRFKNNVINLVRAFFNIVLFRWIF